jgi:hypothetical protein
MKPVAMIVSILLTVSPLLAETAAPAASAIPAFTRLGVRDTRFTLNGVPTFLYGLSMYGALGEPDQLLLAVQEGRDAVEGKTGTLDGQTGGGGNRRGRGGGGFGEKR